MARVLVAEDNVKQAALLRAYLEREGHAVVVVHDGRQAVEEVRRGAPDLLLLDVMLPRLDGRGVLRALRADGVEVPVIVLSALSTERDQLLGFDLGADDYVVKPYSPRQVMARVRALLRRSARPPVATAVPPVPGAAPAEGAPGPGEALVAVGGLVLDRLRCEVTVDGRPVRLTPRELTLLEALAEHPGRVRSRRDLLVALSGPGVHSLERTVDMHVMNLRRKVEEDPAEPRYLLTVKGRGYKLAEEPPAVEETGGPR
jgi:DNA-binding response OmpR family regulator